MYSKHREAFFSYCRQITVRLCNSSPIHLCAGGYVLSDHDATDGFHRNLSSNFSVLRSHPQTTRITETAKEGCLSQFNCSVTDILNAIHSCPNSSSSLDSSFFGLIKATFDVISEPLTIIYQHSLQESVFPDVWRGAVIIPLYKVKGKRDLTSSYRPTSLGQCFGNILEKVIYNQLSVFIISKALLSTKQHDFFADRSALTNLLQ